MSRYEVMLHIDEHRQRVYRVIGVAVVFCGISASIAYSLGQRSVEFKHEMLNREFDATVHAQAMVYGRTPDLTCSMWRREIPLNPLYGKFSATKKEVQKMICINANGVTVED